MRKTFDVQTLVAAPNLQTAGQAVRRWLWPPLAALLLCFLVLAAAYALPRSLSQDIGAQAPLLSGLYADEHNQQLTYAYTGGDAVLALPQLGRGSFAVSLTAGAPTEHLARRVHLGVGHNSYPIGSLGQLRTYHVLLRTGASGDADVHIRSDTAPVGSDSRALGILLDRVAVLTLQPMGIPGSVRTSLLLTTALLWLAGVFVLRSDRLRLALILGGSLATCCLYILGRGTWQLPAWWVYRLLGVLGVGLLVLQAGGRARTTVPRLWQAALVVGCAGLLISRRPDALLNAQFWAEDGAIWYRSAYNGPLQALLTPHTGYFQTLPRSVATVSLALPLVWAPLMFNLVAVGVQILPLVVLLSSRYVELIPSFRARLLLALAYIAIPNREVHVNLTNAQWHLALTTVLLVLAQPSPARGWRCFDIVVVALAAVSGPFCIVLAPLCLLRSYARRSRWLLALGLLLGGGALIQLLAFVSDGPRLGEQVPLGASPALFARIVGGQIFAQTGLGREGWGWLSAQAPWAGSLAWFVMLGGLALVAYALWHGPLELRLFTLFAAWIMLGALVSPVTGVTSAQWEVLALPGVGLRYWRIPILAFVLVLVYLAFCARARVFRWSAVALLLAATAGNVYTWRYDAWADLGWRDNARAFAAAAPGTKMSLPIHPDGWTLSLVKH